MLITASSKNRAKSAATQGEVKFADVKNPTAPVASINPDDAILTDKQKWKLSV